MARVLSAAALLASGCATTYSAGAQGIPSPGALSHVPQVANAAALPACTASLESQTRVTQDDDTLHQCRSTVWVSIGSAGGSSNSFETMNAPAGTDPVAESSTDTLNWLATSPITITGDSGADSLTFAIGDVALGSGTSGNYAAGDAEAGAATSVAANSVALTTDTTGGYAASTTEAGGATSLEAGAIDATTELAGSLCGTNEILEDGGASWSCIATPSGGDPISGATDTCVTRADGATALECSPGGTYSDNGEMHVDPVSWENSSPGAAEIRVGFTRKNGRLGVTAGGTLGLEGGSNIEMLISGPNYRAAIFDDADPNLKLYDTLQLNPISTLPTCNSGAEGMIASDSDSNELCYCDGTSWTGLKAAGACG